MGRKSESLSSLFRGLIRHFGISTSALRAQLGGKGLGFVHCSGGRLFSSLLEVVCALLPTGIIGSCSGRQTGSKERLRPAVEASYHRAGYAMGLGGAHQPPPTPAYVRRSRHEGVHPQNLFSRSLGIFPLSRCMRHPFVRLHHSPGAPFPSPFPVSHTEMLCVCLEPFAYPQDVFHLQH